MFDHVQHIAKLKQQPRQGQTPLEGNGDERREFENSLKQILDQIPKFTDAAKSFVASMGAMSTANTNFAMGLGKVLGLQESLTTALLPVIKNITFLEERNKSLNASFKLPSKSAQEFANKLRLIGVALKVGDDKLFAYAENLKGVTAGFIQSSKIMSTDFQTKLITGQKIMLTNLGVTEEAAQGYERYAQSLGKTGQDQLEIQSQLAQALADTTGIDALTIQSQLTEEIGGLTEDLQLRYSKIPGSLELAILKTRALGTSMAQLNTTSEGLLDIESSISNEIELQQLTGKRLLDQNGKSLSDEMRKAVLMNDANKLAELQNYFIEKYSKDLENNVLAQKAAANWMNIQQSELARMIQMNKMKKQNQTTTLLGDEGVGISVESIAAAAKGKPVDTNMTIQTTAELAANEAAKRESNIIQQLTASGVDVSKISDDVIKGFGTIMNNYENMSEGFRNPAVVRSIGGATIYSETALALKTPFDQLTGAISGLGTKIQQLTDKLAKFITIKLSTVGTKHQDALIMNDGLIQFNPTDKFMRVNDSTMIAGTNVDGNKKLARAIQGGTSIDYNRLAAAIASAMQHVRVEAHVKTDTLLAATKMNRSRLS